MARPTGRGGFLPPEFIRGSADLRTRSERLIRDMQQYILTTDLRKGGNIVAPLKFYNAFGNQGGSVFAFDPVNRELLMLAGGDEVSGDGTRIQVYGNDDTSGSAGNIELYANAQVILRTSTAVRVSASDTEFRVSPGGTLKLQIRDVDSRFQGINDTTTGSAANVFVNATSGLLARSTSSAKYKTAIEDLMVDIEDFLSKVRAKRFETTSKADKGKTFVGLIAEDVASAMPEAAILDDDGEIDNYDLRAVVAAQQEIIRDLHERVKTLERSLDQTD